MFDKVWSIYDESHIIKSWVKSLKKAINVLRSKTFYLKASTDDFKRVPTLIGNFIGLSNNESNIFNFKKFGVQLQVNFLEVDPNLQVLAFLYKIPYNLNLTRVASAKSDFYDLFIPCLNSEFELSHLGVKVEVGKNSKIKCLIGTPGTETETLSYSGVVNKYVVIAVKKQFLEELFLRYNTELFISDGNTYPIELSDVTLSLLDKVFAVDSDPIPYQLEVSGVVYQVLKDVASQLMNKNNMSEKSVAIKIKNYLEQHLERELNK